MTTFFLRPGHVASPWMILLSVALHLLALFGVLAALSSVYHRPRPQEMTPTRVKLVASGSPELRKIATPAVNSGPVARPERVRTEKVVPVRNRSRRKVLAARSVKLPSTTGIRVAKRRSAKSISRQAPKKPDGKTARNRKDPDLLIRERIKRIREELHRRRAGSGSATGNVANARGTESGQADAELAQWLEEVRDRLRTHWTIFPDEGGPGKQTRISIRVADDGTLLQARIFESSGDPVFDRSAERAAYQAAPYPAVPPSVRKQISAQGGLVLRFTPAGIR